jgi:hypothetical protein
MKTLVAYVARFAEHFKNELGFSWLKPTNSAPSRVVALAKSRAMSVCR